MSAAIQFAGIEPRRAHATDAGYDLFAAQFATISPGEHTMIDTGTHLAIPAGHVGLVMGRSGLAKRGIDVLGGVVDHGYTGSIRAILDNRSTITFEVAVGDRIAQLLIVPVETPTLVRVDRLPPADRGDAGFGSTGR